MINKLNLKVDQHSGARRREEIIQVSVHANTLGKHICKQTDRERHQEKCFLIFLLVIDHFHVAVLLNPKLPDNDVVDTTGGVGPGVGLIIPAQRKK